MNVFAWLSADGSRYLALSEAALIAFAGLVIAGACSARVAEFLKRRRGVALFLGVALFALFASRWPTLFAGYFGQDEDESAHIAIAMTSLHHPIAWRDFDDLTSGPMNSYVLMLPAFVGLHLSYLTTAVLTFGLEFIAIAALYGALSLVFDANVARLGVVPPIVFWSVTVRDEYVHYSSEIFSIALCSLMLWLLALAWRRGFPSPLVAAFGVLGGAIPLAKLQSVWLAAGIVAIAIAVIGSSKTLPLGRRIRSAAIAIAGLFVIPAVVLGPVLIAGSIDDFWKSYILSSLSYMLFQYEPISFLTAAPEIGVYFDWLAAVTIVGVVVAIARWRDVPVAARTALASGLLVLALAVYSIFAPKRNSEHYLLYAVLPVAASAAIALGAMLALTARTRVRAGLATAFVIVCMIAQGGIARAHNQWAGSAYPSFSFPGDPDELVTDIKANLPAGDRMVMWGWRPQYYVWTGTIMGTRDAYTINQYSPTYNSFRQYYRDRYIADITANRPEGFLDAGPESFDGDGDTKDAIESWPEVDAILKRDYVLAAQWKRFRLFVRSDLPHTQPKPPPTPSPVPTQSPSPVPSQSPSPAPAQSPSPAPTATATPTATPTATN